MIITPDEMKYDNTVNIFVYEFKLSKNKENKLDNINSFLEYLNSQLY